LFSPNTQVNFPIALHFRGEVQPGEHYSPHYSFIIAAFQKTVNV